MTQCKNCLQKGPYIDLDSAGLCHECGLIVFDYIEHHRQMINNSLKLANAGGTIHVRYRGCDSAIEHAQHLAEYENKGVATGHPVPNDIINQCQDIRGRLLEEGLDTIVKNGFDLAAASQSSRMKAFAIRSALLNLDKFYLEHGGIDSTTGHKEQLLKAIREIEFD